MSYSSPKSDQYLRRECSQDSVYHTFTTNNIESNYNNSEDNDSVMDSSNDINNDNVCERDRMQNSVEVPQKSCPTYLSDS